MKIKAGVILTTIFFSTVCSFNLYAAEKTETKTLDKGDQIRQEIKTFSEQAGQIEEQIEKIEAPAKPLHKQ